MASWITKKGPPLRRPSTIAIARLVIGIFELLCSRLRHLEPHL